MIYFVNPVCHPNIGDIAIFYATCKLLNSNNIEYEVINRRNYQSHHITPEDCLLILGGGWLGIYSGDDVEWYLAVVQQYKNNRIIFMPNSFVPTVSNYKAITSTNAIIYARDDVSYKNYMNEFPDATIKKCPDIVFSLDRRPHRTATQKFGKFSRNDVESTSVLDQLKNIPTESRFGKYVNYDKYALTDCIGQILSLMDKIQKYEVIITDTLHVSIFAYLLHIPCIITDNMYGKLTNTWKQYDADCIFPLDKSKPLTSYQITNPHDIVFDFSQLVNDLIG